MGILEIIIGGFLLLLVNSKFLKPLMSCGMILVVLHLIAEALKAVFSGAIAQACSKRTRR